MRELSHDIAALTERAETAAAERDAALDAVAELVAILRRHGGYSTAREQESLRYARHLLAQQGRRVP